MSGAETSEASVQNIQCRKAGRAGGRNVDTKINTWTVNTCQIQSKVNTWPPSELTPSDLLKPAEIWADWGGHSSDMSQNSPDKTWCEGNCFLFYSKISTVINSSACFVRKDRCFIYIGFILLEPWFFSLSGHSVPLCRETKHFWYSWKPQLFCFTHCYTAWNHIITENLKFQKIFFLKG